jgi:chitinase
MKPARLLRLAIAQASLAAAVIPPALLGAAAPSTESEKVFVGYVYRMPEGIRYDMYTHLCHAFVTADEQGHLKPNSHVPNRPFVEAAHAAKVKVLLSLGGWGWDRQFAAMVADREAEARYADAVLRLVDDFDYDGLDVDWEYPDMAEEAKGFATLVRDLRRRLDDLGRRKGRSMFLTMAASASPGTLKWLDTAMLVETMDWINVMTYDYAGEWSTFAGHHSPFHASSKAPAGDRTSTELTMNFLVSDKGLPPSRLAVGLPLYGKAFGVAEPYAATAGTKAPQGGGFNFARLEELRTKQGWQRRWDDETKNPWLVAPDGSCVVGYDDAKSAELKTSWAMQQGFRGVFFWQIAGDRLADGSNPVQEAVHKRWKVGHGGSSGQ